MRRSTIGTKVVSLALNTCLVLSLLFYARDVSYADEGFSWSAEFEPMVMRTYGYSPDLVTIEEFFIPEDVEEEPASRRTSVDNELNHWNFAFRGEAEGMKNRWGFGVAGFQFDTQAKLSQSADAFEVLEGPEINEPGERSPTVTRALRSPPG